MAKYCYMCSDRETRVMHPDTVMTRCEGCGHIAQCWDDHTHPPRDWKHGKDKKPKRTWKFRLKW